MASFTDTPHGFSPYVKTLPVDAYTAVGVYKSQKLEEGIGKVQQYMEGVAGLPIDKPAVREYVQTKLGQIKKALGDNISGDFSDQRLISQIGGATTKISSDPVVVNGVAGTATLRAGSASIAEAKKSGKGYGVQNEAKFNEDASNWLNDGDPTSQFRGSYTPYVDIIGRAVELYKAQHGGDDLPEGAFRYNAEAITAKNPRGIEVNPVIANGVSASRIKAVLDMVYQQPDVQQQLSIDGWYNFRGTSAQDLANGLGKSTNDNLSSIEETARGLQLKLATDSTANSAEITKQLQELKEQAEAFKKEYSKNIGLLETNPEALKANIVKQGITSNFIKAYTNEVLKKNPLWETQMEVAKFELDLAKEERAKDEFKYKKEKDAADALGTKKADGSPIITTVGNLPEKYGELGSVTFDKLVSEKQAALDQGMMGLVFNTLNISDMSTGQFNPVKKDLATGAYILNVDPAGKSGYKTKAQAEAEFSKVYEEGRSAIMSGKASPALAQSYKELDPLIRSARYYSEAKKELDAEKAVLIEEQRKTSGTGNLDYIDAYIVKNKLTGWQDSEKRLKSKYSSQWDVGLGIRGKEKTNMRGDFVGFETGAKEKEYNNFAKSFDTSLAPKFQALEEKYRERQMTFKPLVSTVQTAKPEEKEAYRISYHNMAISRTEGNMASKTFRKLVAPDYKGKVDFGGYYDPFSKEYYLTVSEDKGQPEKMKVEKEEFESILGTTSNAFWQKYGDDLSLTNNVTTDVPIDGKRQGINTAYQVDMPRDSKFNVKYHVVNTGGNYNLKLYISDNRGNLIVGPVDAGLNTTMDGVMAAEQGLKSDLIIQGIIDRNTNR